jgi:hypothetical protein
MGAAWAVVVKDKVQSPQSTSKEGESAIALASPTFAAHIFS